MSQIDPYDLFDPYDLYDLYGDDNLFSQQIFI